MTVAPAADADIAPDPAAVAAFLRASVVQQIHLAWIIPDRRDSGACGGRWFGDDTDAAVAWAVSHNAAGRNVYWTVNEVRRGLHKKPEKADITSARFVHVDIDPPKDGRPLDREGALEQLKTLDPCFIIDSGGGLQAFWRLDPPSDDLFAIEAINLQVRHLFAADACQNIDRVMRIPGTINWPDKGKRARGRVPALARIVTADSGEAVGADQLRALFARACRAT